MMLLHKKKRQKNSDQIMKLLMPMLVGIMACVFCLVSMTWAWFTASVQTESQTIQSANRSTSVKVYEVSQSENKDSSVDKTLVKPEKSELTSPADNDNEDKDVAIVQAGETLVWNLSPEKTYEVVMTGGGTASTGYCRVALSNAVNGRLKAETKHYTTCAFDKDNTVKFTYNTGGFLNSEGVTETQYKKYIEETVSPTLTISSHWGKPIEDDDSKKTRGNDESVNLLSDGDVLGYAPIPCPEAKAETEIELEGFEALENTSISAEEDYKVSLVLKDGYQMPGEVVVNIDGKDYVIATSGDQTNDDAPYYDAITGVLTVPSLLLSDGSTVGVKATAIQIPEPASEEQPEENIEETLEETPVETENSEEAEDTQTDENKSSDKPSGGHFVTNSPVIKEEDNDMDIDEPAKTPAGDGGDDDDKDDDKDDENTENSSTGNTSSDNDEEKTENEKADVTLNLSQLTINLEETQIPTNADLVLTLSAKEDMELPERIIITLDKTIRDEDIEDEEITEDKTEYIINTDGKENPDGFEFNAESGELTISSELLEGVKEITIADTEENEADEDETKASITFEVKNLTFDFSDDEIVTDEDVVITFTAGEGYELPETIIITIDGVEYIIYTSEEDSEKNPEEITFDIETGTLTISKDLLKDAEAITIAAEGVEKEDEESKEEENPDADKKDESEDKDNTDNKKETDCGEATGKENESETDVPTVDDNTEDENGTDFPATDDTTDSENGTDTPAEEDKTETDTESGGNSETPGESSEPDTEPTTPVEPSDPGIESTTNNTEDNTNAEQGDENAKTEEPTPTPDTESNNSQSSAETDAPVVAPETTITQTSRESESATGENSDDSGLTSTTPAISVPATSTTTLESKETSLKE